MAASGTATRLLSEAWQALSGEPELPAPLTLTGTSVALESVFPVMDVAAAAAGAALLAASLLEATRTGRPPAPVALDLGHLACAIRSERYVQLDGQRLRESGFAPLSRFFPTADGWIRLHANYPWHRQRVLDVLGSSASLENVASAVAGWTSEQLEDAIVSAGGCAAAVRGVDAWRAHPQGAAVSGLPLLRVDPDGAAARFELPPAGQLPASGIRVLDLTRVIAGPVCTRTLAAHGADVLRIDSPDLPETPAFAHDSLAGKRSALLDLHRADDRARFEALLGEAHVLVQGYRPGALARFGLAPDELLDRHPGLVVLSLSAWSHAGPWAHRRGFDSLVQAASGIAASEAAGDAAPGVLPAQLLDHATGYLAAAAVLFGLARRQRTGTGCSARVSLSQTAAWLLRQPQQPRSGRPPEVDPTPYLVELDGPEGTVHLISPPGRLANRPATWPTAPARYGADPPAWR